MSTDIFSEAAFPEPCLTLAGPADILAAVPYLLGFHPADSLVVIGLDRGRAALAVRWDLPLPPGTLAPLPALLRREEATQVVVVGYGPGERVTPAVDEATTVAARAGVGVGEALRVHDGRYWSYLCDSPICCPPAGTPYDLASSRIAAEATLRGMVALPDRRALQRMIDPVTGPAREAVRRATAEAVEEFRAGLAAATDADAFAAEFVAGALVRVRAALESHAAGDRLGDAAAARLGLDLAVIRVRDEAWSLMGGAHATLWKDLVRRLEPRFAPPAAALLAMASWRGGDNVMAGIALERALETDPRYSMATLLMHALRHLMPPALLDERLPTPAELDAAMGPPRASWLLPLLDLLDEPVRGPEPSRSPPHVVP